MKTNLWSRWPEFDLDWHKSSWLQQSLTSHRQVIGVSHHVFSQSNYIKEIMYYYSVYIKQQIFKERRKTPLHQVLEDFISQLYIQLWY